MSSELSPHPTPETHPDIFGKYRAGSPYWRDTFFRDAAQKFLIESPRNFAMAMSMRDEFNRTTKCYYPHHVNLSDLATGSAYHSSPCRSLTAARCEHIRTSAKGIHHYKRKH